MTLKARILVVDERTGYPQISESRQRFRIRERAILQEAIKSIASHVPDVVVLDLGLADGDGESREVLVTTLNG
jgi:DNA-binding NarL/FixJ family response regulator